MRLATRAAAISTVTLLTTILGLPTVSQAASVFTVTRFDDPAPGSCLPTNCSLREAVIAANANPGADTILVPAGTYTLAIAGDLTITDNVTIRKTGSGAQATVDALGAVTGDRGFRITGASATLVNIGVINGVPPVDSDGIARGGGIRVDPGASLTMNGGSVTNNLAQGSGPGGGGGIYNKGTVTLNGVLVANNQTGFAFGGAIDTDLALTTITDSVIRNNASGFGGAISSSGSTHVTRSLFQGNSAGLGGAVYVFGCGAINFVDSTVSGNTSMGNAGAIRNRDGAVGLFGSTVTNNRAAGGGGGIVSQHDSGGCPTDVVLHDSILAGNADNNGGTPQIRDCWNQSLPEVLVTSRGYNLVGDDTNCGLTPTTGDQVGHYLTPLDPKLASLAFNGGAIPTLLTHALLPTSTAIDAGDPSCFDGPTDQRGVPRPQGPRCDIGAYEFGDVAMQGLTASPNPVPSQSTLTYTAVVVNAGNVKAKGVTVTDTLPAGEKFKSATASQGTCSVSASTITCQLGKVAAATQPTVTIVVKVKAASGTILNDKATVTATTGDTIPGNDSKKVSVMVS